MNKLNSNLDPLLILPQAQQVGAQPISVQDQYQYKGGALNIAPAPVHADRPSMQSHARNYDWPPGLVGAVTQYIYDSAPRPVFEVALIAALGLLAGILGKTWVTPSSAGLNQYLILVGRSAIGKEAMHTGIAALMKAVAKSSDYKYAMAFISFNDFASGQALQKAVEVNPCFVNITGEFGMRLKQIANSGNRPDSPMQNLRRIITNLYSKSGTHGMVGGISYSDMEKNTNSVEGVAYSLIGETTPNTFYELLTPDMMADGFMSRFTVIEYDGDRPEQNELADFFANPWPELVGDLRHVLDYILDSKMKDRVSVVQYTPDAYKILSDFSSECDSQIVNAGENETQRQMWNRAHLKALKIASLLSVGVRYEKPEITTFVANWAINLIRKDIAAFSRRIKSGDIGLGDDARENKILSIAQEYFSVEELPSSARQFENLRAARIIPRKYLQQRTQKVSAFSAHKLGSTKAFSETMKSLIDVGHFMEVPKQTLLIDHNFHGQAYLPLAFDKFIITEKKKNIFWKK